MRSVDLGDPLARGADALGVAFPLVQAGMGGVATPELAAAVSEAALGTIALYKLDGERAAAMVRHTARLTATTFAVNVIPEVAVDRLAVQVDSVLAAADRRLVLNSYGPPPPAAARAVKDAGHALLVQVGDTAQAQAALDVGADILVCQGIEAGGHLLGNQPLRVLLDQVLPAAGGVPVLAAGGIGSGARIADLVAVGASGVLCGTLFVAAVESAAHPEYKAALVAATAADTTITDRFGIGWPGRRHRVLRSPVTEAPAAPAATIAAWTTVMGQRSPVPCGSAATPTVEAAGKIELMARYAGTACDAVTAELPAAEIVRRLWDGYQHTAVLAATGPERSHDYGR